MLDKDEETPKTNGVPPVDAGDKQPATPNVAPESEEDRPWRGVFAPVPDREVLFTMDVDLTNLPPWEPFIFIDPCWSEDDDE
jgi:hypothetical protein